MTRRISTLLLLAALVATPAAASAQDGGGSVGGGIVGGISAGAAALWAFYPYTGCPLVTVGAARPADACDFGAVAALVGGTATGAVLGADDSRVGYGMGLGLVAGFGAGWLLGQVAEPPRWLNASLMVAGVVVGGIVAGGR